MGVISHSQLMLLISVGMMHILEVLRLIPVENEYDVTSTRSDAANSKMNLKNHTRRRRNLSDLTRTRRDAASFRRDAYESSREVRIQVGTHMGAAHFRQNAFAITCAHRDANHTRRVDTRVRRVVKIRPVGRAIIPVGIPLS